MDTEGYESKVKQMLDDKRTYEVLKSDPTPKYKKELVGKLSRLKQEGKITQEDYDWLYPTAENVPRMYCTPKIHKRGNQLRPTVNYAGSIGYRTSRALADILAPLVGKSNHHLNNSKHLAKEMISVMVEDDKMFISHDVVSLFTNTPIQLALQVIRERLEHKNTPHRRRHYRLIEVHSDDHVLLFQGRHIPTDVRCRYGEPSFPASSQFVYGMAGEAGYCDGTG